MLTFQDQYEMAQQITGDYGAAALLMFKRDINEGGTVFLNQLGRKFNREYVTGNIEANRQYYQLPGKVLRPSEVKVRDGTTYYFPRLVATEAEWNALNASPNSGNIPTHFYIRGNREIGLYPVPTTSAANALEVSYEPQHAQLTQPDFKAGTITVTIDNASVTHSAAGFQPQMVGRYLEVTDGTDSTGYRIASFTSTSQLELENFYEGISGAGRSFRIGEVMKIPEGYQDAPVFFALDRYYLTQSAAKEAQMFALRFKDKLKEARQTFATSTSQLATKRSAGHGALNMFTDRNATVNGW